jgi:hypothetical protein
MFGDDAEFAGLSNAVDTNGKPNKDGWIVSQNGGSNVDGQAWNWNPPAVSKVDRDATHTNWDSDGNKLDGLGAVGGAVGVNGGAVVDNNVVGGDDWFVR